MSQAAPKSMETQCIVAGGGPAGMMLGFLLARAGVRVVVLEKHKDFLRDFRGDTVHPSTLMIMHELGLIDAFLKLPHQKLELLDFQFGDRLIHVADFTRIKAPCKFMALMPQWDFLNFLAEQGRACPNLTVLMEAEVKDLLRDRDRVTGVVADTRDGPLHITAPLTVGADGRSSVVREKAGLKVDDVGAPIDVLWFRVPRPDTTHHHVFGVVNHGKMIVTIERGDYWQCAFIIPKGGFDALKERGIDKFRDDVADAVPDIREQLHVIASWDDVKLLSVKIDRLQRWAMPGLLCIGDAAHAMSPVGGVGINLAVQDAVATANLLAAKLKDGTLTDADLEAIQKRRAYPAKVIQRVQVFVQNNLLTKVISGERTKPPFFMSLMTRFGFLRGYLANMVGMGVRPEHVETRPG